MTQFQNLEILYNQLFNLADEIKMMVDKEQYDEAVEKMQYKDKLIKKLITTKKTVELSDEDKQKLDRIEEELQEKEQNNITIFKKIFDEMGESLNKTKKKAKISSAYSVQNETQRGTFVDITE